MDYDKPVKRFKVLGIPVDSVSEENLETVFDELLSNNALNRIVFIDYKALLKARTSPRLLDHYNEAALVLPSHKSVARAVRYLYGVTATVYLPFDFLMKLLAFLDMRKKSIYLLGGDKKTLTTAEKNLRTGYPGSLFVGRHTGNFKREEEYIVEAIRKASPTLVLCGSGIKGRDLWLTDNADKFQSSLAICVPCCFEVFAGKQNRPSRKSLNMSVGKSFAAILSPWRVFIRMEYAAALSSYRKKLKRS